MEKIVALFGALILIGAIVVLMKRSIREVVADWFGVTPLRIWLLPAALLAYNFALVSVTHSWNANLFLRVAIYFAAPTLVLFIYRCTPYRTKNGYQSNIIPLIVILLLWIPVELGYLFKSWKVGGVSYPFVASSAIIYGMIVLTRFGDFDLGIDWSFTKNDLKTAAKGFGLLSLMLIPLGWLVGFINPAIAGFAHTYWYALPLVLLTYWFFPALAEEFIFRAGIQNIFTNWFGRIGGWITASMVFGFAHINNSVTVGTHEQGNYRHYGIPNWRYVCLATIAGLVYGYVYRKRKEQDSKNALAVSATVHALVDFTWRLLFMGGR